MTQSDGFRLSDTQPSTPVAAHSQAPDTIGSAQGDGLQVPLRPVLLLLLGLLLALAVYQWAVNILIDFTPGEGVYDFSVYFAAALALRDSLHANIFDPLVLRTAANTHQAFLMPVATLYLYPPLLALLLIPFTFISFTNAAHIWGVLNLLLWLASTAVVVSLVRSIVAPDAALYVPGSGAVRASLRRRRPLARLIAWIQGMPDVLLIATASTIFLSLTNDPLQECVITGQVTLLIFFVLVCVPWLERRGYGGIAGGLLVFAALIKVFPIVIIGYFLLRGRWRVVRGAVVGGALMTAVMVALIGVQGVVATRQILSNGVSSGEQFQNEALARVPFWLSVLAGRPLHHLAQVAGYALIAGVAVIFVVGVYWTTRREHRGLTASTRTAPTMAAQAAHDLVGYGWAICTMVLVSPVTWEHHLSWVLPAFLISLWYAMREFVLSAPRATQSSRLGIGIIVALIVGYVLIARELPFGYDGRVPFDPSPYLLHRVPLRPFFMLQRPLGVLLIWGSAGFMFVRARPAPATHIAEGAAQPLREALNA